MAYSISKHLSITELKVDCIEMFTVPDLRRLDALIQQLASMQIDSDEDTIEVISSLVSDIDCYSSCIGRAINAITEFSDVPHIIEEWESEVESRFTEEERDEYKEELTILKLKGGSEQ